VAMCPGKTIKRFSPTSTGFFFDLKNFNSEEHKKATTVGNQMILENARLLAREFTGRLIFRLPLIPGFNDTSENIASLIQFMKENGKKRNQYPATTPSG